MAAVITSNPSAEANDDDIVVPDRDGVPYRFEMIYDDGAYRAYANDAEDLLAVLIPDYLNMCPTARMTARLKHAARTQTTTQAVLNFTHNIDRDPTKCTPAEYAVLQGTRSTPPDITEWSCQVPLVLIDWHYQPYGPLPRPVSTIDDVEHPSNIAWLSPHDPYEYLTSLARLGAITFAEHRDGL